MNVVRIVNVFGSMIRSETDDSCCCESSKRGAQYIFESRQQSRAQGNILDSVILGFQHLLVLGNLLAIEPDHLKQWSGHFPKYDSSGPVLGPKLSRHNGFY